MGTRSLTRVYDQFKGELICTMYCQYDGYPTGVGADIYNALKGVNVVNGYNDNTPKPFVNRMGQLVSYLVKNSDIKYEFTGDDSADYIDYTYHLKFKDGKVFLEVDSFDKQIYSGMLDDFDAEKVQDEDDED